MRRQFIFSISILAAVAFTAVAARAGDYEHPPSASPAKLLGNAAQGPGYEIANPVNSDGYLRQYSLETPYGIFAIDGDQMLLMRLKELAALDAMERTTGSQEFGNALVKAGLSPVQFAGSLVTNPVGTVGNTLTGVGNLFGGIASGIGNAGKTQDNFVASVTGQARQKRLIAYQYGVDPYTDFKPLAEKMDKLANAAAAGGLVVTAAFIAIPGAAGTIISNVSTAETLNSMVRDDTAAQLMDINRKKLRDLGAHADLVEEFLANRHYTPVDVTAIADALARMGSVQNIDVMVGRAASANSRDIAYFFRRRIELTAQYQERTHRITGFVLLGNSPFPLSTTAGNGLVGVFPIDILAWTESTGPVINALTSGAEQAGITGPKVIHISGTATELAKRNLQALGWTLEENAGH